MRPCRACSDARSCSPRRRPRTRASRKQRSRFARDDDWVFATARGTPHGHRNVSRRALGRAARLRSPGQPHPRPRASRSRSTATPISSRTPATRATSARAWPPAHSPTCSSPRQPRPTPRYSNSDRTRLLGETHLRAIARLPNVPRGVRRGLAPIETAALLEKDARVHPHNGRLVLVQGGGRR
jgi:hypothetical protein